MIRAGGPSLATVALCCLSLAADARIAQELTRGELLLGELGCTACHAASPTAHERLTPRTAPDLDGIGARAWPGWLRRFLADPAAAHPGTTMPDVLGALEELERVSALDDLTHFLVSLGGPLVPRAAPARPDELDLGRALFHELGCIACHAPREPAEDLVHPYWELEPPLPAPSGPAETVALVPSHPLDGLATKWTFEGLAAFLVDPLAVRPSGRMPSMRLTAEEARAIALYLLGEELLWSGGSSASVPGLEYEYYEGDFAGALPDLDGLEPSRRGVAADFTRLPRHRDDRFAFRFRGFVAVPRAGSFTFWTVSDDGSKLWIDGRLVVDNDGDHAPQDAAGTLFLEAGRHAITVSMYENEGGEGLRVYWRGAGAERSELPADALSHSSLVLALPAEEAFVLDAASVERGRERFGELGCARCHSLDAHGVPGAPGAAVAIAAPPLALASLDPDAASATSGGCLAHWPLAGRARYALAPEDRAALAATLRSRALLETPLSGEARVRATLSRLGCIACHSRRGWGGPAADRRPYFATRGDAELGDEGRLPPELDHAGAKLRPEWLRAVLLENALARPYMATRMPSFGERNVRHLVDLFAGLDSLPTEEREPAFSLEIIDAGRRLVGTRGLGCIQCHTFAGHRSLGVPAVDLADVTDRLRPGWFTRLLADPGSLNQLTRMPLMWNDGMSPVRDVLDGDPARQIDAIWTYLALGRSAPLPEGLVVEEGACELVPIDHPRVVGVFMDGVSPRTLAVGFPENLHYAFDVQNSRLARAWRGRFFDARGTWVGRAGALERPPSEDTFDLPGGVPFALLGTASDPWPVPDDASEAGYRALGRGYDSERRPRFRYGFADVVIEETPRAVLQAGGARLVRAFRARASQPHEKLWMRAATATAIRAEDASWSCDGGARVWARGCSEARVREANGGAELLLRVGEWRESGDGGEYETSVEVELSW